MTTKRLLATVHTVCMLPCLQFIATALTLRESPTCDVFHTHSMHVINGRSNCWQISALKKHEVLTDLYAYPNVSRVDISVSILAIVM